MLSLLTLPPELIHSILSQLEKADLKQLRLVSSDYDEYTAPIVFKSIKFDLEVGGCDSLSNVARRSGLARHVRTIHLQRRSGMKSFDSFYTWVNTTVYEYKEWGDEEPPSIIVDPGGENNWNTLDETGRKCLWEDYVAEQQQLLSYMSRLGSAVARSMLTSMRHTRDATKTGPATDAERTIENLCGSLPRFNNLANFAYTPAYEFDEHWGCTWRWVQFHPSGLIDNSSFEDCNIDALQLFVALYNITPTTQSLQSVEIFTRGPAFWGMNALHDLLRKYGNAVRV